ncbi:hypothetical protein [Leucobacter sp. NPDC077196]
MELLIVVVVLAVPPSLSKPFLAILRGHGVHSQSRYRKSSCLDP